MRRPWARGPSGSDRSRCHLTAGAPGRTSTITTSPPFYLISGDEVELWTGEQLKHRDVARPGDYLYIPAGVPHVAVNRGDTPAVFVGARTDPDEQESVVMRPELDERIP